LAFRGTFDHSLDNRGRMAVPARYRDAFADGGVITQGPDGCLELYTAEDFDRTAEDMTQEPANHQRGRRLRRALYGRSSEVELDGQGRVLISARFREAAQLTGQALLIGRRECLEIWSPEVWTSESTVVEREYAANLEASGGEPSP
jgi:MraZ protein